MPSAVVTRASAMPPETTDIPPDPVAAMFRKALIIPATVPKRPTNGAVEPIVARKPRPCFNWTSVSDIESLSASVTSSCEAEASPPDLRTPSYSRMPAETTCARCDFWFCCTASISSWISPPWRNLVNTSLKFCVSRAAARKRRYLLTITATEKKDSAIRQQITAAPNTPTFLSSSVKVIISSCAPAVSQRINAAHFSFLQIPTKFLGGGCELSEYRADCWREQQYTGTKAPRTWVAIPPHLVTVGRDRNRAGCVLRESGELVV